MGVFFRRAIIVVDFECAGHAEVKEKTVVFRESHDDVFGSTANRPDSAPLAEVLEFVRLGMMAEARPGLDCCDGCGDEAGGKAAADGFDFGQFRHGRRVFRLGLPENAARAGQGRDYIAVRRQLATGRVVIIEEDTV